MKKLDAGVMLSHWVIEYKCSVGVISHSRAFHRDFSGPSMDSKTMLVALI